MLPVRAGPVFARTLYKKLPNPFPEVAPEICSQLALLTAFHGHPRPVFTVTLPPVTALELIVSVAGDNARLLGDPSWVTASAGGMPVAPVFKVRLALRPVAQLFAPTV